MERDRLAEAKATLRSLVQSTTTKVTVEKLNHDYYEMLGEYIPFKAFGFNHLEQFLKSLNDTLLVIGSGSTATVCFIGSEKSQHIHNLVMNQKSMRSKHHRRRNFPAKKTNSQPKRFNNKVTSESKPKYTLPGAQLSNYENVNRKYMIRTPRVRDAPIQNPPLLQNVIIQPQHYGKPKLSPHITNNTPIIHQNTTPAQCNNKNNDISRNEPNNNNIYSKPKQIYNHSEKEKSTMSAEHQINVNHQNTIQSNGVRGKVENVSSEVLDLPDKIKALLLSSESVWDRIPKRNFNNAVKINGNVAYNGFKSECDNENDPNDNFHMKNLSDALDEAVPKFAVPHDAMPHLPNDEQEDELNRKEYPGKLNRMYSHRQTNGFSQNTLNPTKRQQMRELLPKSETKNSLPHDINESEKIFETSLKQNENQLDDAIPQFAANDVVFRLDVPKIVVPFGKKIPPYTLSTDIKVGTRLKIFISEIHSAYRFWFHIQKDDHELDELMYQLECYYTGLDADELRIPDVCITKGQVCASAYNGLWHRGEILSQAVNGKVKVLFMDYGTVSDVSINDIKYLKSCYATLPCQALRGCLSYIQPNGPHWNIESTVYFLSLVNDLMLFAEISEIDEEERVYYMVICETHNGVVQINKALIEKKYALYDSNWKDFKIKQNDGHRKHHPREDFPKFSILESGEYPNLTQLVYLQQQGIEYESIYDTAMRISDVILNKNANAPDSIRNMDFCLLSNNPFRKDIWLELAGDSSSPPN